MGKQLWNEVDTLQSMGLVALCDWGGGWLEEMEAFLNDLGVYNSRILWK